MNPEVIARMNRYLDAAHDPKDRAHGKVLLEMALRGLQSLDARFSDDPALGAEDVLEYLPPVLGLLHKVQTWAEDTAHQSYSPAPPAGARL